MPRRTLLAGLIAVASASLSPVLSGQGPPGYYATVNPATAATLRATLHAVIDDHTRFPYTSSGTDTWNILEQAQQDPANASNIVDLYRNASYVKIGGGVGVYNREHSWPKSYGFPDDGPSNYPYTDCHLLFLSDAGYNTARSNRAYQTSSQFGTEQSTLLTNGTGGGSGVYPGNSNWYDAVTATGRWQTWGDRRGDVARAVMYADVRYAGGTHGVTGAVEPDLILTDNVTLIDQSNTGSNELTGYMGVLSTLLLWHSQDPVDQRERNRHEVVYGYQGNRNPFIDHPEWVGCVFSSVCGDTTPPVPPTGLVAPTVKNRADLDWANNTEPDLAGYRVYRSTTSGGPYALVTSTLLPTSAYSNTGLRIGAVYFYVVRAVDTSGNESPSSNQAVAWPRAPVGPVAPVPTGVQPVWINEIHYDNVSTDQGEFIEVAGAAGTSLSGYTMHLYNGATGTVYGVLNLGGTLGNQQNGFGTWPFVQAGLQNDTDGVALVAPGGQVLQFLSWEGTFAATAGPAVGMTSTLIPTAESGTTPVGFSLQLQGTGNGAAAFAWSLPLAATMGFPNTGQTFQ